MGIRYVMAVSDTLDRYRFVSRLGSGGMATVVLAEDKVLGRQVALKRMIAPDDVQGLSRLRREALVGASLSHPNLVSIYDIVASEDGELVIVMEYVPGETLSERLTREGNLPVPEALRILDGVAAALDAIHRRGIVHRDVKPANILLGPGGTIKLADLGIASEPDRTRITTTGAVLGSFRYMAPEQLEGGRSTPAIDIYALSAVAFEVLSGRKARQEPNPVALAHAIATQDPPDLGEAWPEAPPDAAQLLMRGMATDPTKRPRSAGELTRRLRAALAPEPTARVRVAQPGPTTAAAESAENGAARPHSAAPASSAASKPPVAPSPPPARRENSGDAPARVTAAAKASPDAPPRSAPAAKATPAAPARSAAAAAEAAVRETPPKKSPPAASARRESPPAALAVPAGTRPRSSRGPGLAIGAVAALVAAAVIVAIIATGGSKTGGSKTGTPKGASAAHTPPAHKTSPTSHAHTPEAASASGSTSSQSASGSNGVTSSSGSTAASTSPSSATTSSPVSSVESFYHLAAAHQYAAAWALADPTFRSQLGGYQSFEAGQQADRAITFDSARVLSQSSSTAKVQVTTTSVRTNGTRHCGGTVDLKRASPSDPWLVHLIGINCTT